MERGKRDGVDVARQPHEDLHAWQEALELVVAVYETTKQFPADERFALTDQLRRAVVSIPSNIAEGNGRENPKAYLQFCLIAHGSLREVETQVHIARRLGYLDEPHVAQLRQRCASVGGPLRGLIAYLRRETAKRGVREDDDTHYDAEP